MQDWGFKTSFHPLQWQFGLSWFLGWRKISFQSTKLILVLHENLELRYFSTAQHQNFTSKLNQEVNSTQKNYLKQPNCCHPTGPTLFIIRTELFQVSGSSWFVRLEGHSTFFLALMHILQIIPVEIKATNSPIL